MPGWDALLGRLAETPRENGSAELHETAAWIAERVLASGLEPGLLPFSAHPYALRLAGVLILVGSLAYARLAFSGRWRAALAAGLALPALLLAELELGLPVFGWIGAEPQAHLRARLEPPAARQTLVLAAHYDTKTDLLDHVERAPVDLLALPMVPLLWIGAAAGALAPRFPRRRCLLRGAGRAVAVAALAYGAASFAALSAGALVPSRSPGALDDGGSCAVLIRLAEELAARPPERTRVELLWLSAEEVGVQGSRIYAAKRFAEAPAEPVWVVNLEGLGASPRHAVLAGERSALRTRRPDPGLVARLDAVHRAALGAPLATTFYAGATDARSFLARGIPAATLVTHEPGTRVTRHLHSAADSRSRLDEAALDASLAYLAALVRDLDREPIH